jgi:hypothetical protein
LAGAEVAVAVGVDQALEQLEGEADAARSRHMSRGPQSFRQNDLTKAVKALAAAGKSVAEIWVDKTGAHIVVVGAPDNPKPDNRNEWDDDAN